MAERNASPEMAALLEEEHAPWEALDDDAGELGARPPITLRRLFASQPEEVIRTLQSQGVVKLGEFSERSGVVFPAFGGESILTLGAHDRRGDHEREWRAALAARAKGAAGAGAGAGADAGWSTDVLVEAYVVAVERAADPDAAGLLQPLLRRYQQGGCGLEVFGLPAVQAVVAWKWEAFARRLLMWELACFSAWLLAFYVFTGLFQDEDTSLTLGQLLATPRGAATVAAEAAALAAMAPFLVLEYGTLAAYGLSGWFNVWNGLDVITYCIQVAVAAMHLSRRGLASNWLSVLLALQCVFMLFRLQYFSRGFKSTRFAFLEAVRDVVSEIRHYFLFMIAIMFGFAAAFHILFRRDQKVSNFDTIAHSFLKVYSSQDGLDYQEMLKSHVPVAASLLNVAYSFVMGMVIINLLIGVMSNALARVTEHEALKMLLHKAVLIDELEATLPPWLERRFAGAYPRYVHVLRIDPDRLDRVDLRALWAKADGEGASAAAAAASDAKLEAIQAQLARLEGGVSALGAALQAALAAREGCA